MQPRAQSRARQRHLPTAVSSWALRISKDGEPQALWVVCLSTVTGKKPNFFLCLTRVSAGPVPGTTEKACLCLLYSPLQVFMHMVPLSLLQAEHPMALSLSLFAQPSQHLIASAALCWSCSTMSMSVLHRGPQNGPSKMDQLVWSSLIFLQNLPFSLLSSGNTNTKLRPGPYINKLITSQ